jgi:GIY-YIG catalytic domain-containing protein
VKGVYFLLGPERELLYIGKAVDLRRRIAQHRHAHDVAWIECEDPEALEAELIVALRPPRNKSLDGRWAYVHVEGSVFTLSREPSPNAYGCFPSLGVGVLSRPGNAVSAGYVALLRLLWHGGRYPRAISADSPPASFDVGVSHRDVAPFLRGTSDRLLRSVDVESREPYLRPALRRDLVSASEFFRLGPRRVHELRLRHGVRARTLAREDWERLLRSELDLCLRGDERLLRR